MALPLAYPARLSGWLEVAVSTPEDNVKTLLARALAFGALLVVGCGGSNTPITIEGGDFDVQLNS